MHGDVNQGRTLTPRMKQNPHVRQVMRSGICGPLKEQLQPTTKNQEPGVADLRDTPLVPEGTVADFELLINYLIIDIFFYLLINY